MPPRLLSRRPDAPPALDALVGRLLAKNPLDRPDTTVTLRTLEQLQANPSAPSAPFMSAPPTPAPMPQTRPYTQVSAPAAPAPRPAPATLAHLQPSGSWWIAGVLVSLMAAILVSSVALNLTSQAVAQLSSGQPSRSASPSPKPTPSRTTPSRTSTPDPGQSVALGAALQGVRLALGSLPDSAAKTELQQLWDAAGPRIAEGRAPKASLVAFERAVKTSSLQGWEQQAVLAATGIVRSLL